MLKYILLSFLFFPVAACSSDEQANTPSTSVATESQVIAASPAPAAVSQTADYKIIFFLDPNGEPCRMQDAILNDMTNELNGKVNIHHVQTTIAADRDIFYHYGIRALPTLLLADASGKEIKRMPPGVKSPEDIRALIQSIPQS